MQRPWKCDSHDLITCDILICQRGHKYIQIKVNFSVYIASILYALIVLLGGRDPQRQVG